MTQGALNVPLVETDSRFSSGPWTGWWQQPPVEAKPPMEMLLTFRDGILTGVGRDRVGNFLFKGRYDVLDGQCRWVKSYLGKHDVFYHGKTQKKGIVGQWTIESVYGTQTGTFAMWPEGEGDPTQETLTAAEDLPVANTLEVAPLRQPLELPDLLPVGVGTGDKEEGFDP